MITNHFCKKAIKYFKILGFDPEEPLDQSLIFSKCTCYVYTHEKNPTLARNMYRFLSKKATKISLAQKIDKWANNLKICQTKPEDLSISDKNLSIFTNFFNRNPQFIQESNNGFDVETYNLKEQFKAFKGHNDYKILKIKKVSYVFEKSYIKDFYKSLKDLKNKPDTKKAIASFTYFTRDKDHYVYYIRTNFGEGKNQAIKDVVKKQIMSAIVLAIIIGIMSYKLVGAFNH